MQGFKNTHAWCQVTWCSITALLEGLLLPQELAVPQKNGVLVCSCTSLTWSSPQEGHCHVSSPRFLVWWTTSCLIQLCPYSCCYRDIMTDFGQGASIKGTSSQFVISGWFISFLHVGNKGGESNCSVETDSFHSHLTSTSAPQQPSLLAPDCSLGATSCDGNIQECLYVLEINKKRSGTPNLK